MLTTRSLLELITRKVKMNFNEMVTHLKKDPKEIVKSFTPELADVVHMTFGVCTEVREFVLALFNSDTVNMVEEYGDCLFYLEGLEQALSLVDKTYERQ